MNATVRSRTDPRTLSFASPWWTALMGVLFFVCASDQFFGTRIQGYNVRFGQLALLPLALLALSLLWRHRDRYREAWSFHILLFKWWLPFFLAYGVAAVLAVDQRSTILKFAWALFNIPCAALVCLSPLWGRSLKEGFLWGMGGVAATIWIQATALFGFGVQGSRLREGTSEPLTARILDQDLFLGYVQYAWALDGLPFFRPNAFFYEPSYAGCSLALAAGIFLALRNPARGWASFLLPAGVLSAVILIGSRTGILSILFLFTASALLRFFRRPRGSFRDLFLIGAWTALFLGVILLFPLGQKYFRFLAGPLGTKVAERVQSPESSEGRRIDRALQTLRESAQNPFLGKGVVLTQGEHEQGLAQISMNTWLELLLESGWVGLSTFLLAVLATLGGAWRRGGRGPWADFLLTAWLAHLLIHLNLTQTFTRLDYWLLLFLSVRLLVLRDPIEALGRGSSGIPLKS